MDKHRAPEEQLDKLREIIKAVDICMLTTLEADGTLHSRPMSNNRDIEFDGDLWFFTEGSSPKIAQIEARPQVSCGFSDPQAPHYATVSGTAEVVRDRAKIAELWNPMLKAWFPEGPDGGDIALLKVTAERAEYWDGSKPWLVQAVAMAKAMLTGERMDYGENAKVTLK